MQKVGVQLLNRLRNIYDPDDPNPVRKPCDLFEFYAHDYTPPAGGGFDPAQAVQRFAAIDISYGGEVYMRKVVSRGTIQKVRGQQANTVSVTFSNVDSDRYLAFWAQTQQIEGMWLVIRYVERDITGQSAILIVGRAGKPSTINNGEFSLDATTEIGNLNQQMPPRSFLAYDSLGRDPSDPEYEGYRFVNLPHAEFTQPSKVPSTSFFGRLFGKTNTVYTTYQYSGVDATPYGNPLPEVFGRCQMPLTPFLWLDRGLYIIYNMAACNGPIDAIINIKSRTQGISDPLNSFATPPAPPEIHLGDKGGTGTNASGWIQFPTAGVFSHTAGISAGSTGERPETAAVVPEITAIIKGRKIALPDGAGVYASMEDETAWKWSDNPVHITRFILTKFMGIRAALIEDAANIRTAQKCDAPVIDRTNGEQIIVTSSAASLARFRSTGILNALQMRRYRLGEDVSDPVLLEQDPDGFWDPGDSDPPDIPTVFTVQSFLRVRYNFNAPVSDRVKAYDYLFKTLYQAFRGYHIMNASGRLEIRMEDVGDNGLLRTDIAAGATRIPIDDVTAWAYDLSQRILIGYPGSIESEVRFPLSFEWTTDANAITLAVASVGVGAAASGATLAGGDATHQASATVTLSGVAGAGGSVSITINGITAGYQLTSDDTLASAALMLVQAMLAETRIARFIDASAAGAVVTIKAKWGVLVVAPLAFAHKAATSSPASAPVLTAASGTMKAGTYLVGYTFVNPVGETTLSPLASLTISDNQAIHVGAIGALPSGVEHASIYMSESPGSPVLLFATDTDGSSGFTMNGLPSKDNAPSPPFNSTAEEVLRVAMSFADNTQGASILAQAALTRANILTNTYNFPLGSEQTSINQITGQFRDAKNDFALTPFKVNDPVHQALVGQENSMELDLTGVDNWNQASRLSNLALAKYRDGDWFNALKTWTGEALLLEEDDIIASSSDSGGHVNVTTRIESISISPQWQVSINRARRYASSMHRDSARQHVIPLPTTLRYSTAAPPPASTLVLTESGFWSNDGIWVPQMNGVFNFGGFIGEQRARFFVKPHGSADTEYIEAHRPVFPDGNNQGSFELMGLKPGDYTIQILTESFYGKSDVAGALTVNFTLIGEPPSTVTFEDIPSFIYEPHSDAAGAYDPSAPSPLPQNHRRWNWGASPDEARGEYEIYENLTGAVVAPGGPPFYFTGGTTDNFIYRGPRADLLIDKSSPFYPIINGGYLRLKGPMGHVSRWIQSTIVEPPGLPYLLIQGYVRDVAVPWSGGGTVELRARFLGSPNSDWSS
ncbi:MAG: hypothetical protein DMF68_13575 [Acidobacteria bacterium]|nr:MAG: hypothetical protein DMF68_13575 [Acidobacteriota bacterium]